LVGHAAAEQGRHQPCAAFGQALLSGPADRAAERVEEARLALRRGAGQPLGAVGCRRDAGKAGEKRRDRGAHRLLGIVAVEPEIRAEPVDHVRRQMLHHETDEIGSHATLLAAVVVTAPVNATVGCRAKGGYRAEY
jgi:hypothetical protein